MSRLRLPLSISLDGKDVALKDLQGLALVKTVAAPNVTHLKFVRT